MSNFFASEFLFTKKSPMERRGAKLAISNFCVGIFRFAALGLLIINLIAAPIFAQSAAGASQSGTDENQTTLPQMPTMPQMPSVATPSLNRPFYTPGQNMTIVTPSEPDAPTAPESGSAAQSPATATNSATNTTIQTSPQITAQTTTQRNANLSPFVTAADLTSLSGAGLLGNLYSLLGLSQGAAESAQMGALGQSQNATTNALLGQVLAELADIKKQNAAAVQTASETETRQGTEQTRTSLSQPVILRFIVNGYDVLATCRSIYFSERAEDGTFLLTADRRYIANGQTRNETFYLLFKTTGSSGFSTQYAVEPAVVQDSENTSSFVYQLAERNNLTATKTGNLVTMRVVEPRYNMDLLIDIGNAR